MKYIKRPIVVEATQWFKNGDHPLDDVHPIQPSEKDKELLYSEGKVVGYYCLPSVADGKCVHCSKIMRLHGFIDTLEGGHSVCPGDFIITGIAGETYPCKPDIFEATYEKVE